MAIRPHRPILSSSRPTNLLHSQLRGQALTTERLPSVFSLFLWEVRKECVSLQVKTLHTKLRFTCVSRSRRFGKSMAADFNLLRRLFKGSNTSQVFAGVYLTGILPIKKYKTESALNNFTEYSMIDPKIMEKCFGFTKEEVMTKVKPTKFQNDMAIINSKDDVLTVLIHLGYLSYIKKKQECYIPNHEVAAN